MFSRNMVQFFHALRDGVELMSMHVDAFCSKFIVFVLGQIVFAHALILGGLIIFTRSWLASAV